uniref:Uncharacterized protein n=1 Tax=Anopheles coluzzii TaxID=1518534 RepID=A0A6E8W9V2_ANOCL
KCGIIFWNVKGHGSRGPGQVHRSHRAFHYSLGNDSNRYTRSAYLVSEVLVIASMLQVE